MAKVQLRTQQKSLICVMRPMARCAIFGQVRKVARVRRTVRKENSEATSLDKCGREQGDHVRAHLLGGKASLLGGTRRVGAVAPGGREVEEVGAIRSEERRVGQECRSRWSPDY